MTYPARSDEHFYAYVEDDQTHRKVPAFGPFPAYSDAASRLDLLREHVRVTYPDASFLTFGVARVTSLTPPQGAWNHLLPTCSHGGGGDPAWCCPEYVPEVGDLCAEHEATYRVLASVAGQAGEG